MDGFGKWVHNILSHMLPTDATKLHTPIPTAIIDKRTQNPEMLRLTEIGSGVLQVTNKMIARYIFRHIFGAVLR